MKIKIKNRVTALTLAVLLILSAAGCRTSSQSSSAQNSAAPSSSQASAEKATLKVATLKGPSGLSMVKLMSDNDEGKAAENYKFSISTSPDEVVSKITGGDVDIAAVPTNVAATLYSKTNGKIQIAAVTTLGVLYVLTNGETITSVKDLKGKNVCSSGQGAVPEYALNYILKQNGLEAGKDVTVEYKAEHAELAAEMIAGKVKIAVLPEPFVTQVMMKNKDVKNALNLSDEWKKTAGGKSVLSMGCVIAKKDFIEKNKDAFDAFLKEYKASAEFTNSDISTAAKLSEKYGIMKEAVAKKAIPNCSVVYMDGDEMKTKISEFFKVLYDANPKSVGGKLPSDDFYYKK